MMATAKQDPGAVRPPESRGSLRRWRFTWLVVAMSAVSLILAACGATGAKQPTPGPMSTATTPSPTTVKAYFAHHPEWDANPTQVLAVARTVPAGHGPTIFAVQSVIDGPGKAEQAQGYYSPLSGALALISTCPGEFRDFDLTLNRRGTKPEAGTMTMRFCRPVDLAGDLDGPRVVNMLSQTLLQFSWIRAAVILNQAGDCLGDLSGLNVCLGGSAAGSTVAPTPKGYAVKVYFSNHPDSDDNPAAVFAVSRTAPTLGVATYAVSHLIAGPTAAETSQGYFTPLAGALTGSSTCGGADFTITLDHKGTAPEPGTATLKFCRTVLIPGELAGARMSAEMAATLTQFYNIKKAVVLNQNGKCFDDLSGQNACLT